MGFMVQVPINYDNRDLYVKGNGDSKDYQVQIDSPRICPLGDIKSFREKNNFSYSSGSVEFNECDNCVVLSDFNSNYINGIRDSLVLASKGDVLVMSFSNLEKILEIVEKHLVGRSIKYSIPQSVVLREDLVKKDIGGLRKEIISKYGLKPIDIKPIKRGRTRFGLYYVKVDSEWEFVLKYQGQKQCHADVIANISNKYPSIFSKVRKRSDSEGFTFRLEDGLYGLEEFIHGKVNRDKTPRFYRQMGRLITRLHDNLNDFIEANPSSIQYLSTESRHLSESNLLAIWLDLTNHYRSYELASKVIRDLITEDVSNKVQSLPKATIHGDLNRSNIIWNGSNPRIIDKETIKISRRVMELQIPLLFTGPTGFPEYSSKSLEYLSEGLALGGKPLSKEEFSLMGHLLKYCLIKNYAVRNIRRGLDQDQRLTNLNLNLKRIGSELR